MTAFSRRTLILFGLASFAVPRGVFAAENPERIAEKLIAERVNAGRADMASELPAFVREPVLDEIARERSRDMAAGAPFDHQDEHGGYPAIEKIRARYSRVGAMGENIAQDYQYARGSFDPRTFAGRAVKGWFDSPGHRENILSPWFTHSGVGVALSAGGTTIYATQVFWGPPPHRR